MTTSSPPTLAQQRAIAYSPKPFAALSLFASLHVLRHLVNHPKKRGRMYHRLVGHMNVSIFVQAICMLWGNWAVQEGTPYFAGAAGTVQTCTVQGFLNVLTTMSVASYYASLSICSYVSVKNKFKEEKYNWIEKWIHFACIIPSLVLCTWMAATENMNPSGSSCFVAAYPPGCQSDPDVPCERGGGESFAVFIIGSILVIVYFIIPLCSMLAVYVLVGKFKQQYQSSRKGMTQIIEAARKQMLRNVLCQISLYLFAFWATYIAVFVQFAIQTVTGEKHYNLLIFSNVLSCSQGFVVMWVYYHLQKMVGKKAGNLPEAPVCRGRNRETDVRVIRLRATTSASEGNEVACCNSDMRTKDAEVTFNIFDGTPDEASPWAKYIDQSSEEVHDEDGADIFFEERTCKNKTYSC